MQAPRSDGVNANSCRRGIGIMAFGDMQCAVRMAGAALALAGIPSAVAQGPWPESVSSEYRIEVPVMGKIGTLRFQSKISGTSYTAEADGEYRGTLGVFSGNG